MRTVGSIKVSKFNTGVLRAHEVVQDEDEVCRVKKSCSYSNLLILKHVPSHRSSRHSSIVSHVKAVGQVVLLVG